MKKISIFIFTAILFVSVLCVPAFGASYETVNFGEYANISPITIYGLKYGENGDYTRWVGFHPEANLYEIGVEPTGNSDSPVTYDRFAFHINLKAPSVDGTSLAYIGSASRPFYSGDYISARIRFKAAGFDVDTLNTSVHIRSSYSQNIFNWSTIPICGSLKVVFETSTYKEYEAIISYRNEGPTIYDFNLQFMFYFLNSSPTVLSHKMAFYDPYISHYYYGSGDDPDLPVYDDFSNSIGNGANDLKDKEDSLMNDTEQGRENTISLFENFAETLSMFTVPLLAIKGLFDYLIADTVFEGILLISLTLGLLAFVFNIFPSIQARQHRERNAEAQRTKNAQYNAMMNKLNNHNKGGS